MSSAVDKPGLHRVASDGSGERTERIKTLQAQLKRYWWVVRNIIGDALHHFRRTIVVIALATIGAVLVRIAAVGVLTAYAIGLETGREIGALGYSLTVTQTAGQLYLFAGASVALLAFGGGLAYWARMKAVRLAEDYEAFCAQRALVSLERVPMSVADVDGVPIDGATVQRLSSGDCRLGGRTLRQLLGGIFSPAAFLAFAAVLVWLDAELTAYLGLAGLAFLPVVYRTNVKAVNLSRDLEKARGQASGERKTLAGRAASGAGPRDMRDALLDRYLNRGFCREAIRTFNRRVLVVEEGTFVGTLFFSLGIFIVVAIGGTQALSGERTWSEFVAYVVLARLAFGQVVGTVSTLTQVNRFYPYVSRYFSFVRGAEGMTRPEDLQRDLPESYSLKLKAPLLLSDDSAAAFGPGVPLAVVSGDQASRFLIPALAQAARCKPKQAKPALFARAAIVPHSALPNDEPLRYTLGLADDVDASMLSTRMRLAGLESEAEFVTEATVERGLPKDFWLDAPSALGPALRLVAAEFSERPLVLIDAKIRRAIDPAAFQKLAADLHDRTLVFVYGLQHEPGGLLRAGEAALALVSGRSVTWQVSAERVRTNQDKVGTAIFEAQRRSGRPEGEADMSDLDEDE